MANDLFSTATQAGGAVFAAPPGAAGAPAFRALVTADVPDLSAAYATTASLAAHAANTGNPHAVTKSQVGLGNCDNTSDAGKPVSAAQAAALALKAPAFVVTPTKTSAYALAANELVPVDTTAGAVALTLPNAPAAGTVAGAKLVVRGGTNNATLTCQGPDRINTATGPTSATLSLTNHAITLQYFSGTWYVTGDALPLSQLDSRYLAAAGDASAALVTPAGATTARSLATRWAEAINVKDFGAKGDGTTDDTAAINAAVALAQGGGTLKTLVFPAGRYKIASTLAFNARGLRFLGQRHGRPANEGGTRLEFSGTGPCIQLGTENLRTVTDATIGAGSTALTSATANFTSADVGSGVAIFGAGAGGVAFPGVIASVQSATAATLMYGAVTAVSGATMQVNYYDSGKFDGPQGLTLENISLAYTGSATTALLNGTASYGTGTYGVRDFRGGDVLMRNVRFEQFQYGFWGVQSDINNCEQVEFLYCSTGIYLGPRSDQNSWSKVYTAFNDTAVEVDTAKHARFVDCQFVGDGSATTYPITLSANNGVAFPNCEGASFTRCWFEHGQGYASIPAFVGIGLTGPPANVSRYIAFRDCLVSTNTTGTRASVFARVNNASAVTVSAPLGSRAAANLDHWFEFVGTNSPDVLLECHESQAQALLPYVNNGTGSPRVQVRTWGSSNGPLAVRGDGTSNALEVHVPSVGTPAASTAALWVDANGRLHGDGSGLANVPESGVVNLTADLAAKSPLAGSTSLVTLGTVTAGTWQGAAIAQAYLPAPGTTTGTYADGGALASHAANTGNPHAVTAAQVGLGNVTNTSDANKPVSTAQAAANALRLLASANLSDLASAPTARTNLGLGGAATLNVGTAAGTVADGGVVTLLSALQGWSVISDRPCKTIARVSSATFGGSTFRTACTPAVSGAAVRLVYANWWNRATGETPNTNPILVQCAVQPAGAAVNETAGDVVYWATFGGKDFITLPGGRFAVSDPVYLPFTAGTRFFVKTYVSSAMAAGPAAPTLVASGSGSTWGAGTYTVSLTYVYPGGYESAASATASVVLTAGQNVVVTAPGAQAGASGYKVYISAAGTAAPQYDSGLGTIVLTSNATASSAPPSGFTEAAPQVEGGVQYYPTGGWVSGGALPGGANNGEGFVNSVNRVGDGRAVTFGNSTNIFAPVAVLGLDPAGVHGSVALVGDSILDGSYDMGYGGAQGGFGARACTAQTGRAYSASITPRCGFIRLTQFGETEQTFAGVSGTKRSQMAGLATAVVEEYGANDLRTGSRSAAQLLADSLTTAARFTSRQRKVIRTTLTPVTGTTDGYTTVTNQNLPNAYGEGNRRQFNGIVRSATGAVAVTGEAPYAVLAGTPVPSSNFYPGGNGVATTFLTAYPFATGTEAVTVAGAAKVVTTDYAYYGTAVINGTTYASGITFGTAPANGAAVLISYTKAAGYTTLAGPYARVCDTAAAVEVDSTNALTANGGWWKADAAQQVATRAVTAPPTSTSITDGTQSWTQDQWKGYCVRVVSDSTTPGAVNQVRCILSNTATVLSLYTGHSFTTVPSSAATYAIEDQYTPDGLHPSSRGHVALAAPLAATLTAEVVS